MRLYIVPGALTLLNQQGNPNSYILSSLISALHYMGGGYASENIIRHRKKSLLEIQNKGRNALLPWYSYGTSQRKKQKIIIYCIEEWHTYTTYDIFWNQSTYPNLCLLLDTWHRTNSCITVCGKWILHPNFEVEFPLT